MPAADRRTLDCPQCEQPVEVELRQLLDLGREPELRRRFLQGEINALRCAHCGAAGRLAVPLVVHDPANEQVIFFIPNAPQITPEIYDRIQRDLGHILMESIPGAPPDYLFRPALTRDPSDLTRHLAGDEQAEAEEENADPALEQLYQTILAFIQAKTWTTSQQIVETHPELLTAAADAMLAHLVEAAGQQNDEDARRIFTEHRDLLNRCRTVGVEAAFAEKTGGGSTPGSNIPPELAPLLAGLTPEQQQTFLEILRNAGDEESFNRELANHPELLAALQQVTRPPEPTPTPPPLQSSLSLDLQVLLQELSQPARLSDMPRRIEVCRQALQLAEQGNDVHLWAILQGELGNSLVQNPLGNRSDNLEQAIAAYEAMMTVMTRSAAAEIWANTQNNLANAYLYRIRGERDDNLEQAIIHFKLALEVRTRAAFPADWAQIQNNLGEAYRNRIKGKRTDNVEQAIFHYEQAMEVYTRAAFPADWAMTQHNLGLAYWNRIKGERADNLERAIFHY
ncbi:MAG TPA: CpXC domain-containing protein, partial [Anaerolineae bacterium]|nr:CpXC domain-containing protein [Anaerolineae bacterium]